MGDRVIAQVSRKRRHSKSTADVQEVTGKMASSNSTTTSSISYEKFVIVAEDEWKFQNSLCDRCGNNNSSAFSVHFGGFEWDCSFDGSSIKLWNCEIHAGKMTNDVHVELFIFDATNSEALYERPIRHVLNASNKGICEHTFTKSYDGIGLTIRILVERPFLPDFTLKDVQICGRKSNGQLRVGAQIFYINKEILSMFSDYFDRMYNGNFTEANQQVVNLESESCDPALFHDFLLTISLPGKMDALPNRNNVAKLLELARFYDVDLVRNKCERHLKICREMPRDERIVLAKKYGLKEVSTQIVQETRKIEEFQKICYKLLDEF